MELTRRGLFGLLAGLPLVGRLMPTDPAPPRWVEPMVNGTPVLDAADLTWAPVTADTSYYVYRMTGPPEAFRFIESLEVSTRDDTLVPIR